MPRQRKTAKHKLNRAYLNGVLIVAGAFGLFTGSWLIFLIAAAFLVLTCVHDGSIRQ